MASWFKFWTSAREDSKLRSLSDAEFRYWLLLLCIAAENEGRVDLSDPEDVCIEIGLLGDDNEPVVEGLAQIVGKLEKRRLVTRYTPDEGVETIAFNGWERRQTKPSDRPEAIKERVVRHRERQRNANVTRYVTPTEAEAEADTEAEKGVNALPACLSRSVEGIRWTSEAGSKHDSAASAFWATVENHRGGIVPTKDHSLFVAMIADTCPPGCTGSEAEVDKCLAVLEKAAAKTSGRPSPLFRRICEEDR